MASRSGSKREISAGPKADDLEAVLDIYDKVSDVPENRVWFASKNLTPHRMHLNDLLIGQIIAKGRGQRKKNVFFRALPE